MIPRHKFELVDLSELFTVVSKYENPDNPDFSTGNILITNFVFLIMILTITSCKF